MNRIPILRATHYVAQTFKARMKELGMSQYRFCKENPNVVKRMTLTRILREDKGGCSFSTFVAYADLLGLEIKLVPKDEN